MRASRNAWLYSACTIAFLNQPLAAQSIGPDASEAAARAALSVLGLAATPNETMSSFSFMNITGETSNFRSTQLRRGLNPIEGSGLYLEGLVAYQEYNPVQIFPGIAPATQLDVRWSSVAATFGVGWDFPVLRDWTLRPAAHLSLGHVSAGAFLSGGSSTALGSGASGAIDGELTAGGIGASLGLFREGRIGMWETEYRFRQTYMEFFPINEPRAGDAKARSNQTTFFSRHRRPLSNFIVFELPTKAVLDAGIVLYHGEGAKVLKTDWLATAGVGIELDIRSTGTPLFSAGRVMLNGVVGDGYQGFSIGFGLGF